MKAVADAFAAIADGVAAGQPDAALRQRFQQALSACRQAAASAPAELQPLLANVQQALATWDEVWPRLGGQEPFRNAVIREARTWAQRFADNAAVTRRTPR